MSGNRSFDYTREQLNAAREELDEYQIIELCRCTYSGPKCVACVARETSDPARTDNG